MTTSTGRSVVVGAGVIGLTTAVVLCDAGWAVRVVTDRDPLETTSAAAGALIGLSFGEPLADVRRWDATGSRMMNDLANDPDTGVHRCRGLFASREAGAVPPPITEMPGFAEADSEACPNGFVGGFWLDLPVVDMSRYLAWLVGRLTRAGGSIERAHVSSLDEVSRADDVDVLVNCSGLGARRLGGDSTVRAVRGQHVIVDNPGLDSLFMEGPPGLGRWVSWVPHGDHVVIGGVRQPDVSDPDPDVALAHELLAAAASIEPLLDGAEIVGHRVGFRPERPRVRCESEPTGRTSLIHNYGHGGSGVTLSWGCALDVAAMASSRLRH